MRRSLAGIAIASALASASCDGAPTNAICELTIELPAAYETASGVPIAYAAVHARRGGDVSEFGELWGNDVPLGPLGASRSSVVVSVVSDAELEAPLAVKVVLCAVSPCADGAGIVRGYLVERAFYRGEVTRLHLNVAAGDTNDDRPMTIGRCRVAGCGASGTPSAAEGFCDGVDGRHPCD